MKKLTLMLFAFTLLLTACVSTSGSRILKSEKELLQEVAQLGIQMGWKKADGHPLEIIGIHIPSHGLLGDLIARGVGGRAANTKQIASLLLNAKENPDYAVLFITNNVRLDSTIIANAMEGLKLDGVKFFLAARPDDEPRFEPIIKASGAEFVFIDKYKRQNK